MNRFLAISISLFLYACGTGTSLSATDAHTTQTMIPEAVFVPGQKRFPIVMLHGMAGWDTIGSLAYFNRVPKALAEAGYTVYTPQVDPFQGVDIRATQVAAQIDSILAETEALKVHLVAHSQGGLDARYVISQLGYGNRVASLTTVSTPHQGTKLADVARGTARGDGKAALAAITNVLLGKVTNSQADLSAQIESLSTEYATQVFNPANPDDARVKYFSVAGKTQPWLTVDKTTTDIVNPTLLGSYWLVRALQGANDGLVPVDSARWGTFLGEVPADHWDEIGQPPLVRRPAFGHVQFYVKLADFLDGGPAPLP